MSWKEYVTNLELSKGVTKAAIMGLDGSCWAASQDFNVEPAEVLAVVAGLLNATAFQTSGVTLAGVRYIYLGGTDEFVRARKGQTGVHISKTTQALIVGYYEDPITPGVCSKEVEKIADYLKSTGF